MKEISWEIYIHYDKNCIVLDEKYTRFCVYDNLHK